MDNEEHIKEKVRSNDKWLTNNGIDEQQMVTVETKKWWKRGPAYEYGNDEERIKTR